MGFLLFEEMRKRLLNLYPPAEKNNRCNKQWRRIMPLFGKIIIGNVLETVGQAATKPFIYWILHLMHDEWRDPAA